jgi:glycosyltransferase involved in cell wall biosynthesis
LNLEIAQILISNVWGEVNLESLNKGIGGREGALLYLSKEWASSGNRVVNFVNIEQGQRVNIGDGIIDFLPLNMAKPYLANIPTDVCIAWECPSAFEDHRILNNVKLRICEMQVCHFSPIEMQAAADYCDYVAALSPWHKEFLLHQGLEMESDEVVVFPNGVDISKYPEPEYGIKFGNNPKFVYSSSPDRGLWGLLQIWPEIRKEFPEATLKVGYGAQKWIDFNKWSHGRQGEMAVEIEQLLKQDGVEDIGKIGQDVLSELQQGADAWLYPLDAMSATESGCITAVENAAAGNPIVTTDCDCMATEFGRFSRVVDVPWNPEEYYRAVKDVLSDEMYYEDLQRKGRKFAEGRDWSIIASQWVDLFNKHV